MASPSEIKQELRRQWIETPSWAYGNTGTRFKVFRNPAAARDPYEKIEDAAFVHRLTGVAPSVALHIPWDRVDDYGKLAKHAAELGLRIGAINPNVFQEDEYRLGSVCNPDAKVRRKATDHLLECVEIAAEAGSPAVSLWFADGTNYPGQDDIRARQDRLAAALRETYDALPDGIGMLLEYKLFEPGFYTMDVPDWGTSLAHCLALGPKANVLVDTGHHAPGTNIEFIVASLLRLGRLGGFHFNSRFYADDDLLVGAADPYQLFRILCEVVSAGSAPAGVRGCFHARPMPQHRGQGEGRDPLSDERPGSHSQSLARRPRRAEGSPGRRRCPGRPRRAQRRLQYRRPPVARGITPGNGHRS